MKKEFIYIFLLRVSLGILFLYAGISKLLDPSWSAVGYIKGAVTFSFFYQLLLDSYLLPFVDLLNIWGPILLGISLIFGLFVRLSTYLGALLMLLYYLPILKFPYVGTHSFLIDEHVIYALVLLYLGSIRAGRVWGFENWCSHLPLCSRYPKLRMMLG